ncbi:MAG: LD-carboxypeptidase [Flavobacteriales bacterium]
MIPPFLRPGDVVAICATARWITDDDLQIAVTLIESWGFRVEVLDQVMHRHFQLAGQADERRSALQRLMDRPDIQAICIARGGYGTVHLVDELDWSGFMRHPKWICGYSDITVLHAELSRRGVASIHSTMPVSFSSCTREALESLRAALSGEYAECSWSCAGHEEVNARGTLWGGNLSVLCSLLGSPSLMPPEGALVFLEDVDEMLYHVDRMLTALKRAGIIQRSAALIAGGFTRMKDNTQEFGFPADNPWGSSTSDMLRSCFGDRGGLVTGMPAGHLEDNRAFYLGLSAKLDAGGGRARLRYDLS